MLFSSRMRVVLAAGVLAAFALSGRAAEVDRLLPDKTELVVTLNVRQLLDSPLAKKYAEARLRAALNKNEEARAVLDALGFDPLKDLDSITLAAPDVRKTDKGLLILHGRFEVDKFRAKAEDEAKTHPSELQVHTADGYTVYETKGLGEVMHGLGDAMFVALVNGQTLVAAPARGDVVDALKKGRRAAR